MNTAAIIDYGMSNLDSVGRAVEVCGATPAWIEDGAALDDFCRGRSPDLRCGRSPDRATCIILPGVGAFADAMAELHRRGLAEALHRAVHNGAHLLGICLGMQLLATTGYEGGETPGLGFIPGQVRRLEPETAGERIPHVGWNAVTPRNGETLFKGIEPGTDFYFVHSYHLVPEEDADAAAVTPYCGEFVCAARRGNVAGVQFHPEKSRRAGLTLMSNFLGRKSPAAG